MIKKHYKKSLFKPKGELEEWSLHNSRLGTFGGTYMMDGANSIQASMEQS